MPNLVSDLALNLPVPGLGIYFPVAVGGYIGTPHAVRAAAATSVNRMYCSPIIIGETMTFDEISSEVVVAYAATSVVRLGIYSNTAYLPGTKILDAGTHVGTTAARDPITISQILTPGIYWLAISIQVTATSGTHRHATWPLMQMPSSTPEGANPICYPFMNTVTGALPTTFTFGGYTATAPIVWLHRSA